MRDIVVRSINMFCDNKSAIFVANNMAFYGRMKLIINKLISTPYTKSNEHLVDIFTKALGPTRIHKLCIKLKLGLIDIFAPA